MALNKHIVGIFSRDGRSNYKWLAQMLLFMIFKKVVEDVHSIYISNDFSEFASNVSRCTFAILYHTKKRGRLNVADVTDALYNNELEHLSDILGKKNLIVVMDDVDDSSEEEKIRTLQEQNSITRFAIELLLFSEEEKRSCNMSEQTWDVPTSDLLQESHTSFRGKIYQMKDIMSGNTRVPKRPAIPASFNLIEETGSLDPQLDPAQSPLVPLDPDGTQNEHEQTKRFFKGEKKSSPDNQRCSKRHKIIFGSLGAAALLLLIILIIVVSIY